MRDRISITDLAKLRNVTTETLRHYDRIGLFNPIFKDSKTGYRYYSILQYEKLGTIKELRELGMGLKNIKEYFDNRSVTKSLNILINKHGELKDKIKELKTLEKSISEKIEFLTEVIDEAKNKEIVIKEFDDRKIITFGKMLNNEIELSYGFLELENSLEEISPILASNRLGFIIPKNYINLSSDAKSNIVFAFVKGRTKVDKQNIKVIEGGTYACIYNSGKPWDRLDSIKKLVKYIKDNGYIVAGDALQVAKIDITVTDVIDEECFEIQIPIEIAVD